MYVDYDRVAVLHAQAILNRRRMGRRYRRGHPGPAGIIAKSGRDEGSINFRGAGRVLMFAILHFIPDDNNPQQIIREFTDAVPRCRASRCRM